MYVEFTTYKILHNKEEVQNMKKVIGIISLVLFIFIAFQSCAAGLGNALSNNKEVSGSAGMMLAVCMLIAGIVALVSKLSKGVTITAMVFYAVGGIIGISNVGHYKDLMVWSVLSLIFAVLLLIHLLTSKMYKKNSEHNESA